MSASENEICTCDQRNFERGYGTWAGLCDLTREVVTAAKAGVETAKMANVASGIRVTTTAAL